MSSKAVLVLEDGSFFEGISVGHKNQVIGEICFNTTMTGYQEVFSDPSYYGQIITMTTSHIGNYGVHKEDMESDRIMIRGLVCNELTEKYSRPRSAKGLDQFLKQNKITGIKGVDTRKLVRHIRSKGAMNAIISAIETDVKLLQKKLKKAPKMEGLELSSKVSCQKAYTVGARTSDLRVALLDLGTKTNIIRCLTDRGAYVKVFPIGSTYKEILSFKPRGIMLSNGPGDPSVMKKTITLAKKLIDSKIPVFGICLGHQIMALSQGIPTYKMHNGHRGVNHPVLNLNTKKAEVTSQNHGFVVDFNAAKKTKNIEVTHIHLNDQTLAGIKIKNTPSFSVQFHPESSAGPNDSRYLFDDFISKVKRYNTSKI